MRELERDLSPTTTTPTVGPADLVVVGAGRTGGALAAAGRAAGTGIELLGRGFDPERARNAIVLLCVPDGEIASACDRVAAGGPAAVGHTSGATTLGALDAAAQAGARVFSLHPLQTIPTAETDLRGAPCAIAGGDERGQAIARELAERLGMAPFAVPEEARAAYHAAASIASNFLVALEESAAELLEAAGVESPRQALIPLVLRTAANWADRGAGALTGPIARGDEATVAAHLEALRELAPRLLPLYETLAESTRATAERARATPTDPREGSRSPRVIRTRAELRAALAPVRRAGRTIGLVPTMGYLHDGHLSLIRAARERSDVVVMSLFVNPTQFGPGEDLESYPQDEARDLRLAGEAGADLVYAPSTDEVYPRGFGTYVEVEGLSDVLCGAPASRGSGHFRGVTTVVAKLLGAVGPDLAFFGQKDAQQAIVIKRMVRDLELPVEIVVAPTVREPDGLAMSSRNAYLEGPDRQRATALSRGLLAARDAARLGGSVEESLAAARRVIADAGIEPEYLEARDAEDLTPAESFDGRPVLIAVAARVGRARLIDNVVIGP